MNPRLAIALVTTTLMFSACNAPTGTSKQETRITGTKKKSTKTAAPKASTAPSLMVEVRGPAPDALAKHAAALIGVKPPAAYALAQASGSVPVVGAEVVLRDGAGRSLSGNGVRTDKDGKAGLPAVFSNATLAFVEATYAVDGARLTLSAVVASPKTLKTAAIDPASTLIAKKLSYLGRIREVDLAAYPADVAGKLAAPLAAQLGDEDVAAAAVLDPEKAARALDALLAKDAELKPALQQAAGGENVAYKAIVNVTPKVVVTPAPTPTPKPGEATPTPRPTPTRTPTPTPTPRPSGVPVIPTPIPTPTKAPVGGSPTPVPTATPTAGV